MILIILIIAIASMYLTGDDRYSNGGCGIRSLVAVLNSYNVNINYKSFSDMRFSEDGNTTYYELRRLCSDMKINSFMLRIDTEDLRKNQYLGILHIDGHHFVGLVGYDSQTIHIAETGYEGPPRIERWSDGDLMARWDGVILVISKPKDGTIPSVAAQKAAPKTTDAR